MKEMTASRQARGSTALVTPSESQGRKAWKPRGTLPMTAVGRPAWCMAYDSPVVTISARKLAQFDTSTRLRISLLPPPGAWIGLRDIREHET